jgi:hypothetical protein
MSIPPEANPPGEPGVYQNEIKVLIPNSPFAIPHLRDSLSAIRAIPEAWRNRLAALGAGLGGTELDRAHMGMSGFIKNPAAAGAFKERISPFNGNQRDEEKTDIVIKALEPGGRQSASGTGPSLVIHLNFLGLYPPDKKEEDPPPRPIPTGQGNF